MFLAQSLQFLLSDLPSSRDFLPIDPSSVYFDAPWGKLCDFVCTSPVFTGFQAFFSHLSSPSPSFHSCTNLLGERERESSVSLPRGVPILDDADDSPK